MTRDHFLISRSAWKEARVPLESVWLDVVPEAEKQLMRKLWTEPLYDVLRTWSRTNSAELAAVYVDERVRESGSVSEEAITCALEKDERALATVVGANKAAALVSRLRLDVGMGAQAGAKLRVTLLGDCLMTETRAALLPLARSAGLSLDVAHYYFSAPQAADWSSEQAIRQLKVSQPDMIAVSFFSFDGLPLYRQLLASTSQANREDLMSGLMQQVEAATSAIRQVTDAPLLLHAPSGLPLRRRQRLSPLPPFTKYQREVLVELRQRLADLVAVTENALLIDETAALEGHGKRALSRPLVSVRKYADSLFHPTRIGSVLAQHYLPRMQAFATLRNVKVICVDFDNTLWAGVMAEGPVVHDERAQQLLRDLCAAGILIASVSKNSAASIRWDEMLLDQADFAVHKISWDQKVHALSEIAAELNLGLDTFVFLDDNPTERGLVEQFLPAVRTLDATLPESWTALQWLLDFPATKQTEEARSRTLMYQQASARRGSLVTDLSSDDLMRSLELRASISSLSVADLPRAAELLARTNQFNTTTRRRDGQELQALIENPDWLILAARLADRHGSFGLVGVVILHRDGGQLVFDSLVMSCRAMGFGLQRALVISSLNASHGWHEAIGLVIPTLRNEPVHSVFDDCGFERIDQSPAELDVRVSRWQLLSGVAPVAVPDWLSVDTSGLRG